MQWSFAAVVSPAAQGCTGFGGATLLQISLCSAGWHSSEVLCEAHGHTNTEPPVQAVLRSACRGGAASNTTRTEVTAALNTFSTRHHKVLEAAHICCMKHTQVPQAAAVDKPASKALLLCKSGRHASQHAAMHSLQLCCMGQTYHCIQRRLV